jgi:hypothetical protein
LLLAFISTVILGFGPHRTHGHIFLSHHSYGIVRLLTCLVSLSGKLLLAFVSTVILSSRPYGIHDLIFLSHEWLTPVWSSLVYCCWPSPLQSFLVLGPAGSMTIFFFSLSTLTEMWDYSLIGFQFQVNCCWPLLAQSFWVLGPMEPVTIILHFKWSVIFLLNDHLGRHLVM